MKNNYKILLLLFPTLAIASSLGGTAPYTAMSNMQYQASATSGRIIMSKNGLIVTDSSGNIFFSNQDGHSFQNIGSTGQSIGPTFITPRFIGSGATLWYKNGVTPIQVSTSYASHATGLTFTIATNTNAPANVTGTLKQVVAVPMIDLGYPNSGAVALTSGRLGNLRLNYYELNGQNNYQFSYFTSLAVSHIVANSYILVSAGRRNLRIRDLTNGNETSTPLPNECSIKLRNSGHVKFMYAGISNIYLICNRDGKSPKDAMLYRFNNTSGSFDAGQRFNPTDPISNGDEDYKAASDSDDFIHTTGIVFLEQSKTSGDIKYISTCNDGSSLASCVNQPISGSTLSIQNITSGAMTYRSSAAGHHIGYAALFVGNSNTIFKVDLDRSGNYVGYSTY